MEVLTRSICTDCKGAGAKTSAAWVRFYEADDVFKEKNGRMMEEDELKEWFSNEGYFNIPPEEPMCESCEGKGIIEEWVALEVLLAPHKQLR